MFFFSFFLLYSSCFFFFFFSSRRRHTRSLCDWSSDVCSSDLPRPRRPARRPKSPTRRPQDRSEEHTSELQSHSELVCRLLLEKKKKKYINQYTKNKKTKTTNIQKI